MNEWIKVSSDLPKHRKTLRLARLLKISRREAVGIVIDLLIYGYSYAEKDGLLRDLEAQDIDSAMEWTKKASLAETLSEAGFLEKSEEGYRIHDFGEYAGDLFDKREKTRLRVKRYRESHKNDS
jgi:hypothetical protein